MLVFVIEPKLILESIGWQWRLDARLGCNVALIVIRPGIENFHWHSFYALRTGFCFSGNFLLFRRLAEESSPLQDLKVTGRVGTVLMSMMQPAVLQ